MKKNSSNIHSSHASNVIQKNTLYSFTQYHYPSIKHIEARTKKVDHSFTCDCNMPACMYERADTKSEHLIKILKSIQWNQSKGKIYNRMRGECNDLKEKERFSGRNSISMEHNTMNCDFIVIRFLRICVFAFFEDFKEILVRTNSHSRNFKATHSVLSVCTAWYNK